MDTKKRNFMLGSSAAFMAVLCWATVPVFMKYLSAHMDSWTMNMWRYGIAGVMYVPFVLYFAKKGALTKNFYLRTIPPSLINTVAQILWAMTPYYLDAGLIGIFIKTSIIWATVGSFILFADERSLMKKPGFWIGIMVTFASFFAMSVSQLDLSARKNIVGIIIILVCSVLWGLYPVSVKFTLRNEDPRLAFGLICINTAVCLAMIGSIFGDPGIPFSLPARINIILFLSALVGIGITHIMYFFAINKIGVVASTNMQMATPFLTLMLSFLVFGEAITKGRIIFGLSIIAGVLLVMLTQQKAERNKFRKRKIVLEKRT